MMDCGKYKVQCDFLATQDGFDVYKCPECEGLYNSSGSWDEFFRSVLGDEYVDKLNNDDN